jgi:hypothetical protein
MRVLINTKHIALFLLIFALLISACAAPTAVPPAETPAAVIPLDLQAKGSSFNVIQGGYNFTAPAGSDVSISGSGTLISALDSSLLFSLNGINEMSTEKTDEEILEALLTSLFSGGQSSYKKSALISASVKGMKERLTISPANSWVPRWKAARWSSNRKPGAMFPSLGWRWWKIINPMDHNW